jgi:hypothetical protein
VIETLDIVEGAETDIEKLIQLIKRNTNVDIEKNISFIIGHTQWNRLHPDNQMTLEQYVEYRKQKEEKKEQDK